MRQPVLGQQLARKIPFSDLIENLGNVFASLAPPISPVTVGLASLLRANFLQRRVGYLQWKSELQWYQKHSHYLGPQEYHSPIDVLLRLRALSQSGRTEQYIDRAVERLLFAAFLDDLRDADKRIARVVLFLDGFETVLGGWGLRLLEMLTESRQDGKNDPLLLIIGSRERLFNSTSTEQNPSFE